MHTLKTKNGITFNYNSDLSGDIIIRRMMPDGHEQNIQGVQLPFEDLAEFYLSMEKNKLQGELEQMKAEDAERMKKELDEWNKKNREIVEERELKKDLKPPEPFKLPRFEDFREVFPAGDNIGRFMRPTTEIFNDMDSILSKEGRKMSGESLILEVLIDIRDTMLQGRNAGNEIMGKQMDLMTSLFAPMMGKMAEATTKKAKEKSE